MAKHGATCCQSKGLTSLVTIEHVLQSLLPLTTGQFYKDMKALWNWQRHLKFNRASRAGNKDTAKMFQLSPHCQYKKRAIYQPFMR